MYYTIYKTTNIINGKFYIGKHQTKDLNDGYIGSGKRLKYAIKKYGIDNFHKEILHICESEKQMNILEKILVVPDPELNYNLCNGGKGGFGYINKNLPNGMLDKSQSDTQKQKARELMTRMNSDPDLKEWRSEIQKRRFQTQSNPFKGATHTEEARQKISKAHKGRTPWNKGKPRSEETKQKIRETLLKRKPPLV